MQVDDAGRVLAASQMTGTGDEQRRLFIIGFPVEVKVMSQEHAHNVEIGSAAGTG